MRNHNDNIKNGIAYFGKILKNMNVKQKIKDIKIDDNEILSEEIENVCTYEDKYFSENNLLDWIEMIENADLYKAIKTLRIEEQTLLAYIFYKEKTQSEVAEIYNITHQNISYKINKIIKKNKKLYVKKVDLQKSLCKKHFRKTLK